MTVNQRKPEELLAARGKNIPRGVVTAHPIVSIGPRAPISWTLPVIAFSISSAGSASSMSATTSACGRCGPGHAYRIPSCGL